MTRKKRSGALLDAQRFAQSLNGLIDALPSATEKQQIISQLEILIQFLNDLETRIKTMPTNQDAGEARTAIEELATLFVRAKSNPVLAATIGNKATASRQRPPASTPEEIDRAKSGIARFDSLPMDEVRAALGRMSVRDLQSVAIAMGGPDSASHGSRGSSASCRYKNCQQTRNIAAYGMVRTNHSKQVGRRCPPG
jgi:hypothetical protein